jgi:hypothetical protein
MPEMHKWQLENLSPELFAEAKRVRIDGKRPCENSSIK